METGKCCSHAFATPTPPVATHLPWNVTDLGFSGNSLDVS